MASRVWQLARRILPWVVAAALLVWVFSGVPLRAFGHALAQGQFHWFLPAMLAVMGLIFVADCLVVSKTFTWFTTELSLREVMPIRGASYLMSVINYNLGQGALAVFANRSRGVPIGRSVGTVLLLMGSNLVVLLLLATVGLFVSDAPRAVLFRPYIVVLLVAFGLYMLVVAVKPKLLSRWSLAAPLMDAGVVGHLKVFAIRAPHMAAMFLAHYLAMRAFSIDPPLLVFLSSLPFVALMSTIPISPHGLGTAQYAAVYFFGAYAPGHAAAQKATVLAYSLTTSVLAMLFMITLGLLYLRAGMKLLRLEGDEEADPGASEAEPDAENVE